MRNESGDADVILDDYLRDTFTRRGHDVTGPGLVRILPHLARSVGYCMICLPLGHAVCAILAITFQHYEGMPTCSY